MSNCSCRTSFYRRTAFFGQRKYYSKTFFQFFRISGQTGSGKPGASILGKSLDQEEPNDTSSMAIGPDNLPTHL